MAKLVLLLILGCCIVGVLGQIDVTTCTFATQANCPLFLTNSYCNVADGTCQCATTANYQADDANTACIYNCGTLAVPANGAVDTSAGTLTGDQATYSCNNGFQLNGANTSTCVDTTGWDNTATTCVAETDECATLTPCQNGGTCTYAVNSYTCSCVAGYDGNDCDNNINECSPDPCQNGGTCTDGINAYTCACVAGYDGDNCENNDGHGCENGGLCIDGVNGYTLVLILLTLILEVLQ